MNKKVGNVFPIMGYAYTHKLKICFECLPLNIDLTLKWRLVSGLIYSDTLILEHRFEQSALQMTHPLLLKRIGYNRKKKQAF